MDHAVWIKWTVQLILWNKPKDYTTETLHICLSVLSCYKSCYATMILLGSCGYIFFQYQIAEVKKKRSMISQYTVPNAFNAMETGKQYTLLNDELSFFCA